MKKKKRSTDQLQNFSSQKKQINAAVQSSCQLLKNNYINTQATATNSLPTRSQFISA